MKAEKDPAPKILKIHPDELFFTSFELLEAVGKGCFGRIFRVRDASTGQVFALKKVLLDSNYHNRELSILQAVYGQPNLLQLQHFLLVSVAELQEFFKGTKQKFGELEQQEFDSLQMLDPKFDNVLYILTKCYDTDLRTFIIKNAFNVKEAKLIGRSLAIGLSGLHGLGICHRDLKSENVLVDMANSDVAIGDLGSAKSFASAPGGISYICSRPYRAPELLLGHTEYGLEIDLWSLGCIIFELCSNKHERLFKGKDNKEMLLLVIGLLGSPTEQDLAELGEKRKIDLVSKVEKRELRDLLHPDCDATLLQALESLLKWSPKQRGPLSAVIKLLE